MELYLNFIPTNIVKNFESNSLIVILVIFFRLWFTLRCCYTTRTPNHITASTYLIWRCRLLLQFQSIFKGNLVENFIKDRLELGWQATCEDLQGWRPTQEVISWRLARVTAYSGSLRVGRHPCKSLWLPDTALCLLCKKSTRDGNLLTT